MSRLMGALNEIIKCFKDYAGKEGDPNTLTKAELKEVLQNELGELVGGAPDKATVDDFFSDLDMNMDDRIDFIEFGTFVFSYAITCHVMSLEQK